MKARKARKGKMTMRIYSYNNTELDKAVKDLAEAVFTYTETYDVRALYFIWYQSRKYSYATYTKMIGAVVDELSGLHISEVEIHNVINKTMELQ